MLKQWNVESSATGIPNLRLRISHHCFEIPTVLFRFADQFHVVVELGSVVGLGEEIFQEDRVWNPNRPQEVHGVPQLPAAHMTVAFEPNVSHLDLWALPDHEGHAY